MKKLFLTLITIMLLTPFLAIGAVTETSLITWATIDTTTADGNEPTALAVTERTYKTVKAAIAACDAGEGDGEISIYQIARTNQTRANAVRLRCMGTTDANSVVYNIYSGTLGKRGKDCSLSLLGTLSFTIGTQASIFSTYEYASQLSVTEGDTTANWGSTSADDDRIAEASIDLQGSDLLVIVPTTSECDSMLEAKFY